LIKKLDLNIGLGEITIGMLRDELEGKIILIGVREI
jgi:hypothetical protein